MVSFFILPPSLWIMNGNARLMMTNDHEKMYSSRKGCACSMAFFIPRVFPTITLESTNPIAIVCTLVDRPQLPGRTFYHHLQPITPTPILPYIIA
jgi:hypothetical protein